MDDQQNSIREELTKVRQCLSEIINLRRDFEAKYANISGDMRISVNK
jgi:hypothetical protein